MSTDEQTPFVRPSTDGQTQRTPAEAKAIAAEIDAYNVRVDLHPEDWGLYWIAHLYELHQECYLVMYENGVATVFMRDDLGALRPAGKLTYWAPDYQRAQKKEQETS